MKTTHQLADELLALPDIPLGIEGWCEMDLHEMTASITDYDENRAIIWQKPGESHEPVNHLFGKCKWMNFSTTNAKSATEK